MRTDWSGVNLQAWTLAASLLLTGSAGLAQSPTETKESVKLVAAPRELPADEAIFARARYDQLVNRIDTLEEIPGMKTAPPELMEARKICAELQRRIKAKESLSETISRAEKVLKKMDQAVLKHRKAYSQDQIGIVERKVRVALEQDAPVHASAELKEVNRAMKKITACQAEGDYDTVLLGTELLKPIVDNLITKCRIESANRVISSCETLLAELKAQGEKVPAGELNSVQAQLEKAKLLFANNDYEGAHSEAQASSRQLKKLANGTRR